MHAKLIAYTQPTPGFKHETGMETIQDLVAHCARVSNPANQNNKETADRLITYLIKHKHFSPLEMVNATIAIETTRDIARQILRHRSFSFQEFSQRYANPQDMREAFLTREARRQDPKNRQNSVDLDMLTDEDSNLFAEWELKQLAVIAMAREAYDWALESGIAKEQARVVLPEGCTVSTMFMQGSIRSWIHYCELRTGNGTQKEHQAVAREIAAAITQIFPPIANYTGTPNE